MPYADYSNTLAYQRKRYHDGLAGIDYGKQLARITGQRKRLQGIQSQLICEGCGTAMTRIEFHHRDPSTKRDAVSQMCSYAWKTILAEIAKCDALCVPCHRRRDLTRRRGV